MQTFLPNKSFSKTMEILDYRRLGKQRVEAFQIINCIEGKTQAWVNHPTVRMWRPFVDALKEYCNCAIEEWVNRGYKNNMFLYNIDSKVIYPDWLGNKSFHSSHRQTLLYKDPDYYLQFMWKEKPKYEYWWPVELLSKNR